MQKVSDSQILDALCTLRDAGLTKDEVLRIAKRVGTRMKEKVVHTPTDEEIEAALN